MANRFLIAGGGIGGLGAALGLAQKGFEVSVMEQSPEFGEIGAGIQLGPNAFYCFDYLGIGEQARDMAVFIDQLRIMDALSGNEILSISLGEPFRNRFGNPYAVVHRGDLYGVLLKACKDSPRIELQADNKVTDYEQDDDSVTVTLESGARKTGAALVGADGLWSTIRRNVVGDTEPRVSGHTSFRSVIPTEQMPENLRWNAATLWAGPKVHLVHYPLSDWKVFNLVVTCHNDAPEPVAGKPVSHEEVRRHFTHINPVAQQIIEHGKDWKLWVLCDRDPVENWIDERVVLLGDAAHPMLQYYAQGACIALEDAVCLAHMAGIYRDDLKKAFETYLTRRLVRAARVQLGSRAIGEHVYHPDGAHARVRNEIIKSWTQDEIYDRIQWLYGWSVEEESSLKSF